MVKSKKLSRGSLAVLLMALMLALSMVVGMTGAWFTDSASSATGTQLTFGEVDIALTSENYAAATKTATLDGVDIMPGDTVHAAIVVNNAKEPVYVRVTVTATDDVASSALTLANVTGMTWNGTDSCYYGEIAANTSLNIAYDIVLTGGVYGNTYQDHTLTFSVLVEAIQQANLDSASEAFAVYSASGLHA